MTIRAVLFDLDDTLLWDERSVKESFEATCQAAAEAVSVDPAKLEEEVRREARTLYESYEPFPFTKQIGINPFEALWANFTEGEQQEFRQLQKLAPEYRTVSWTRGLKALGVDDAELGYKLGELFPKERRSRPLVYEETFQVLDELKGQVKLLMLTNGSPDLQKEKIAGFEQLASYFDHIVISGSFGQGKPAAAIFHHALQLLDVGAEEALMVGDKLTTDILGANGTGIRSVWLNRHHVSRSDEIVPAYEIDSLWGLRPIMEQLKR
ncbi:MAG: haloacid dehalogenase [Paenibacillus sp.]|nr:haloacid dehalogenase [Paenibacillus sp.]